ncbi:MAG: integration host factor subunit beta [Gemmataceae bacterium]|nr:integration host factor subunit beta [Gemmataceae bacterium]MDW8263733.1 HU family DNA-binding protein [Gemmataceae bacterium]
MTLTYALFTVETFHDGVGCAGRVWQKEMGLVTKKEIVKQISERAKLTQLKTKEIVQWTFDAIMDTLVEDENHRIELRNFGVFEVKRRKARKARNPRTGERVDVEPKNVVTFKPGKEMEERVRQIPVSELRPLRGEEHSLVGTDGKVEEATDDSKAGRPRPRSS